MLQLFLTPISKKITDKVQAQIDHFVHHNKAGSKDNSSFQKWIHEDIYRGGKAVGGFKIINIADFFKSLRLSWIRRYAFGNEKPLDDHWCDLLDTILEVEPHVIISIINRGSEFLTPRVLTYYPCLTIFATLDLSENPIQSSDRVALFSI